MAGYQNSTTKLYNDSSSLTSASYSPLNSNQSLIQLPTTPTSPAPSFSNSSTTKNSITTNSNANNNSPSSTTNSPKTITSSNNSASTTPTANNSNSNSPAASRSLTNNNSSANNSPSSNPQSLTHSSAFTPYQNSPQHPTPVTTPTSIPKNPLSQASQQQDPTMMTSHLDNGSSPTLGYPPHTHFTNPATPFWSPQWPVGGNGTNGVAVATLAQQGGGSAFMPTYGAGAGGSMPPHSPRPKLTTTIWEDEATLCYQVDARGICVARRQDNDMINGTKLLNVVGMSRGKRDGILKNEKGRVVVKVGAMHLKGVWITFQRAKTLAAQFKIGDILYPLFVDDPSVFLHSSYAAAPMNRIPSMGAGAGNSQWRGQHPYANTFNGQYAEGRPWGYPYGNNNPVAGMLPPASASQASRSHTPHPPHLDEDYANNYNLMNGQNPQGQPGGVVVSSGSSFPGRPPAQYEEEGAPNNGTSFYRPPGLYNLVSAAEVVGGTTPQSGSPQLIGQKRVFDGEENDDYNNGVNNSNQPSPPLAMHPPPLSNIAVANTMNVANSFPSPLNVSPQSSPGSSAFQGWNHPGKRVKYEFPEATTPPSAHSSPRIAPGYQLPGLGAGPSTPGSATTPTQQYTNSSLQMVTNAQGSPHHYSSSSGNNNGPATGTTTPTTEGLERYFQDSAALTSSSPESGGVGTPVEENRRYEQY